MKSKYENQYRLILKSITDEERPVKLTGSDLLKIVKEKLDALEKR